MFLPALIVFGLWAIGGPFVLLGLAAVQSRRHRPTALALLASAILIMLVIWVIGVQQWGREWMGGRFGIQLALVAYVANWVSLIWRGLANKRLGRTATFPVVDTRAERVFVRILFTLLALVPLALLLLTNWAALLSAI
ncbi:hypothetical protein [Aliiroseovarius subalbicans]|uniref:hypothetical protein n=1 Tax=Aliiroseovarius subalbicans TaxID=2925840 RepID=UPI001F570A90|nr:hypothetical protein [Aliiroseovarius subalbicans]MCI2398809.1 hypothetical protein [Aliiroseovarius subalbicans]